MSDPANWKPLTPAFTAAVRRYDRAQRFRVLSFQRRNAIIAPLYHYTDRGGLAGIITNGEFWFTDYRHLNDDKEITFGMDVAKDVLAETGKRWRETKLFCDLVIDLLSSENMDSAFGFYIGSFSRSRDERHQWKNYAAHGQGFSIGLAPHLFAATDITADMKPDQIAFVSPVSYGDAASRAKHLAPIESAARIAAETAEHQAEAMRDVNRRVKFFRELANNLVAAELILHCLTVKGPRWEPEQETRLFILGQIANLAPYVSTRTRGAERVPFIKHRMPLREPGSITEVLIGPNAPADAEDFVCSLLKPFHNDPRSIIHRSTVSLAGSCM